MMTFLAVEPSSNLLPLLLLLAILLVAAKLLGALSVRLGQPAVLGELLAGLLLGPSLIDVLTLPVLRSPGLSESLRAFADIGVLCLMFAAGLETELDDLRRAGRPALLGESWAWRPRSSWAGLQAGHSGRLQSRRSSWGSCSALPA